MRFEPILLVALIACGVGEDTIVGTWFIEDDVCTFAHVFKNNGIWEQDLICELESGRIGLDAIVGQYVVRENLVTTTPTHASCADIGTDPFTEAFQLLDEGQVLRLGNPGMLTTLERLHQSDVTPTASVAVFGCFDGDGFFEERELTEL